MANIKIEIHKRNVEARLESLNKWEVPEEVKTSILDFLNDLELGKVNRVKILILSKKLYDPYAFYREHIIFLKANGGLLLLLT